ncbi:MAG: hypothetical protein ACNI3A_16065 [Desulfovibrio sp.]|uniref:hypothetical protein n=1 Tax=Desulfovibrio sp. 7SRBS1 TaxID=3378064 RepID=UPI003B40CCD1
MEKIIHAKGRAAGKFYCTIADQLLSSRFLLLNKQPKHRACGPHPERIQTKSIFIPSFVHGLSTASTD